MKNKIFNPYTLKHDYGTVRLYESEEVSEGQVLVGETQEMARSIMEKGQHCQCYRCKPRNEIEVIKHGPYVVKHLAANKKTFKKLCELRNSNKVVPG